MCVIALSGLTHLCAWYIAHTYPCGSWTWRAAGVVHVKRALNIWESPKHMLYMCKYMCIELYILAHIQHMFRELYMCIWKGTYGNILCTYTTFICLIFFAHIQLPKHMLYTTFICLIFFAHTQLPKHMLYTTFICWIFFAHIKHMKTDLWKKPAMVIYIHIYIFV